MLHVPLIQADELVATIAHHAATAHTEVANSVIWSAVDTPMPAWQSFRRPLKRADTASAAPRVWRCSIISLQHAVMRTGSHQFTERVLSQVGKSVCQRKTEFSD